MDEIFEIMVSDSELPEPTVYDVVEVRHGQGASGHSHYYLKSEVDEKAESESEGEGHQEIEPRKEHQLSVSVFEEWHDIIDWLPAIASDGDMSRDNWNQLREVVGPLRDANKKIMALDEPAKQRDQIKSQEELFRTSLSKLNSLTPVSESP